MARWFATFFAVFVGAASLVLASWAIALVVDPAEQIHYEHVLTALPLALLGFGVAAFLWRLGRA